jgi:hypothetical protein
MLFRLISIAWWYRLDDAGHEHVKGQPIVSALDAHNGAVRE